MKIQITRLELTNFKCFRHREFTFDSDVTTIRGRNGVGKTTVADAILWCLFGKNAAGQANFDLKTHDADGRPVPNLDHSVEMALTVLGDSVAEKTVTLRRTLRETWVKRRGSDEQVFKNNTTEYYVNGEAYTAKDYDKYISNLISEDLFRAITNPSYFPSLKWQQQREFLTKMVGEVMIGSDPDAPATYEFTELVGILSGYDNDIAKYRKHLSYQIKRVKDKLDRIPVRLEEQHKALPERLDWTALESQCTATRSQCQDLDQQIIRIKSGNGSDVLLADLRIQIENVRRDMNTIEDEERRAYNLRRQEHDNRIAEASRKFNSLVTTQRDLEQTIPSFDTFKRRCQETLDQCERDAQKIREEWAENLNSKLEWSEDDNICPACGQFLPQSQLQEKRQKAVETLNSRKAIRKEALTRDAEKVKATRAEAEKTMADYDQKRAEAVKNLADTKEQINRVFAEKAHLEKEPLTSFEEALAGNSQYQSLRQAMHELQVKLDTVCDTDEQDALLADLESQKVRYTETLSQLNAQLATRTQYDRIQALIAGIEQEQHDLVTQLSQLEQSEDVARQYQDRQNAILESRINRHFSLVRWRLFRTVNNGGDPFDEPYCECYIDGVAYHDGLNQAARLNAGLDIINTLCKHYSVSAPIVLDNSESTINIIQTVGQQVRLQVADTDLQVL